MSRISPTRKISAPAVVVGQLLFCSSCNSQKNQLSALQLQNDMLRQMVASRDSQIQSQKKIIKLLHNKNFKTSKRLERLQGVVKADLQKQQSGRNFEITRVQTGKNARKQLSQLNHGKLDAFLSNVEPNNQSCGAAGMVVHDDADEVALASGWLTPQGTIALAIRRNMSNCGAQDLGLVILEDTCKSTVLRAECKTGAALIASSRVFFEQWRRDIYDCPCESFAFTVLHYRQDATNHRHKMMALELHAMYAVVPAAASELLETIGPADFMSIKRLADVVPMKDGTGAGTLAITEKMLASLGCPTWNDMLADEAQGLSTLGPLGY